MSGRRYATRDTWESVPFAQLGSEELRAAADKAEGQVEAYRVQAIEGTRPLTLEVLWLVQSRRAGVATAGRTFWTDTPTIETAMHRWAGDVARGTRTSPRPS